MGILRSKRIVDFYVYLHKKATTGEVFYVGKGHGDRAWQLSPSRRSEHWTRVARKHGVIVEIVQSGLQEWYAHELEAGLIALYGRMDDGTGSLINHTDGGEGTCGAVFSQERIDATIRRSRDLAADPDWLARHADAVKERSASGLWKARNMEGAKKRAQDAAWRTKITEAARIRAADPEYRAKLSASLKIAAANPEWMARATAINRTRRARPVVCIETGVTFPAVIDAVRWLHGIGRTKASTSTICRACSSEGRSAYGYTWRYAGSDEPADGAGASPLHVSTK